MAIPIAIGVVIGWALDNKLGTAPTWTLTLMGAGIGIAGIELAIAVRSAMKDEDDD